MKFISVQPERGVFTFDAADTVANFARENGILCVGIRLSGTGRHRGGYSRIKNQHMKSLLNTWRRSADDMLI